MAANYRFGKSADRRVSSHAARVRVPELFALIARVQFALFQLAASLGFPSRSPRRAEVPLVIRRWDLLLHGLLQPPRVVHGNWHHVRVVGEREHEIYVCSNFFSNGWSIFGKL